MKKNVFAVFIFLAAAPVWAKSLPLASWQNATIQVSSFPCLTERPRFSGSGLLVSYQGNIWVLTSEHVVIQDKSSATCHEAEGAAGMARTELVAADYLKGLALLKLPKPSDSLRQAAISLDDLRLDGSFSSFPSLAALGYPAGSSQLQTLTDGKLITAESQRALIAGISHMIEAANLPVEYGMSGGVLLGSDSGTASILGFLSHQVLRRETGRPSGANDVNPGDSVSRNDLALAIPANEAVSWFLDQFKKSDQLVWQRDPQAQKNSQEVVQYGPLLFSLIHKNAKDVWDVGGADGSGIGGGDGSGIGGGDDHGNGSGSEEELQTVEITLNPAVDPVMRAKPLVDPTLETWRNWLLTGRKVDVVFLKNKDARRLLKIGSLAQFFTFWLRDTLVPVAVRSKVGDMHSDGEQLIRLASVSAGLAQGARDKATNVDKKAWFSMLRDYALMAENGLASSQDILGTLNGANDVYWRQFYDEDFDAAVAMESSVQNLVQQMKKMGL